MTGRTIFFSQPNFEFEEGDKLHLPYLYASMKAFASRKTDLKNRYKWLDPIFYFVDLSEVEEQIKREKIHVLALSCYVWNWKYQLNILSIVKREHPDCLVVMGGPQPDWHDEDFFKSHPEVDIIVRQDGEEAFARILTALLKDEPFEKIPGLFLNQNGKRCDTGTVEKLTNFDFYPFQECGPLFQEILSRDKQVTAIWETSRGCPYSCTFCDWGSATMQKIRQIPMSRLQSEMKWFSDQKVETVFINDANFGILPRDVEIANELARLKRETGFPKQVEYDGSKMNIDRNEEIAEIFWREKMITKIKLPWQHMASDVLNAIHRIEPDRVKKAAVAKKLNEQGLRCRPELIMGMPGDNYQNFSQAVFQILEFEFSDTLRTNYMLLLPNAPAADPKYRELWQIETVSKNPNPFHTTFSKSYGYEEVRTPVEVVVGTKSYTKNEWVQMANFDSLIKAFHSIGGLTKFLATYCRYQKSISYQNFYESLFEYFHRERKKYSSIDIAWMTLQKRRHQFLETNEPEYFILDEYKSFLVGPNEEFYFNLTKGKEQFYLLISEYLCSISDNKSDNEILDDLLIYQKGVIAGPDYDFRIGRLIPTRYHWPEFFKKPNAPKLPGLKKHQKLRAKDRKSSYLLGVEYDWAEGQNENDRLQRWMKVTLDQWNHWSLEGTRILQQVEVN